MKIHTVIVEDDPMVAQINCQYLQQIGNFHIGGIFTNGNDALDYLQNNQVDLLILDVYMPGISGINLLQRIRSESIRTAVIMVTAATEMSVVEDAIHLGIVDYLIKPFSFPRFQTAVQKYLKKTNLIKSSDTVDQGVVDRLLSNDFFASVEEEDLRKGLNSKTLKYIHDYLTSHADDDHTCESISLSSNLSKVTVRRYLNYLIESGRMVSSIDYETGGRPRVLYRLK